MDIPHASPIRPNDSPVYSQRITPLTTIIDLLPLVGFFSFWIWFYWNFFNRTASSAALVIGALVFALCFPLATGVWTLFRMSLQIQDLCALQRREELALTQLDPVHWLSLNIRRRLIGFLPPPVLNLLAIVPFSFLWGVTVDPVELSGPPIWFLGLVPIYVFGSIQICASMVTVMGVFQMIERLCSPNSRIRDSSMSVIKWSLILILSLIVVIASCLVPFGLGYLIPGILPDLMLRRARIYWRAAVQSYFHFN